MPRYSEIVMDHFQSPRHWGKLEEADRIGVSGVPGQGAYLVLYLKTDVNKVSDVGYQCHGCGATIAAGSMLTEMIEGKTLEECRRISAEDVLEKLDGLPPDKRHCAGFAVNALQQALV